MAGRRFGELQDLISEYRRSVGVDPNDGFFYISKKFYCLDRLLDEVAQTQEALRGRTAADDMEAAHLHTHVWLEFLAETLAYHAYAVQRELCKLPGLGKFDPKGVHDARNKLMEHWDKHRAPRERRQKEPKRTKTGFVIFAGGWPFVRPQCFAGEPAEPIDKGVFANADEFINELEEKLSNEVKKRSRRQP